MGLSEEKDLPLTWNAKTGENVLWKASLPGTTGNSGPIVWGDRVFVTTAARQSQTEQQREEIPEHQLWCFDVATGKLRWRTRIDHGTEVSNTETYAAPTPATDGKAVYCWFGSAVAAAVDYNGKLLWQHEQPGPYRLNPGICSSPVLYEDTMLLLCDQGGGNGWLRALDKSTGQLKWEQKRDKVSHNNGTPILIPVQGKLQLVIQASNQLQGLNPVNGELIWWCNATGFGASPAFGADLLYCDSGNDESGLVVVPTGKGDVTATHVKWQSAKIISQYQSAAIVGKYIYRATKPGVIRCVDLETGKEMFARRAPGVPTVASPIATANERIYFASADKTYVIQGGTKLEILAVNSLDNGSGWSSPAVAAGRLFIRGDQSLFCVGKK